MAKKNDNVEVTHMKCAHPECHCVMPIDKGVQANARLFCCEQCATGQGCGHHLCGCGIIADDERYRHEGATH